MVANLCVAQESQDGGAAKKERMTRLTSSVGLTDLLNTTSHHDLELVCEGQTRSAHQVILAASSSIMADCLCLQDDTAQAVILLPDWSHRVLSLLLDFLYTGQGRCQSKEERDELENLVTTLGIGRRERSLDQTLMVVVKTEENHDEQKEVEEKVEGVESETFRQIHHYISEKEVEDGGGEPDRKKRKKKDIKKDEWLENTEEDGDYDCMDLDCKAEEDWNDVCVKSEEEIEEENDSKRGNKREREDDADSERGKKKEEQEPGLVFLLAHLTGDMMKRGGVTREECERSVSCEKVVKHFFD